MQKPTPIEALQNDAAHLTNYLGAQVANTPYDGLQGTEGADLIMLMQAPMKVVSQCNSKDQLRRLCIQTLVQHFSMQRKLGVAMQILDQQKAVIDELTKQTGTVADTDLPVPHPGGTPG